MKWSNCRRIMFAKHVIFPYYHYVRRSTFISLTYLRLVSFVRTDELVVWLIRTYSDWSDARWSYTVTNVCTLMVPALTTIQIWHWRVLTLMVPALTTIQIWHWCVLTLLVPALTNIQIWHWRTLTSLVASTSSNLSDVHHTNIIIITLALTLTAG